MFKLLIKEENISEATGVNMFLFLKRKNDTTILYVVPFGKQQKLWICFSLFFLFGCFFPSRARFSLKEDVYCLRFISSPISEV
jgi:hypothetical protein